MPDPVWTTRRNRFKERLTAGEPVFSMWATMPWPPIMELAGAYELDAAFIDLEHATFGLDMAEQMIVAGQLAGVSPLVRVPAIDHSVITRVLDAGAEGIIFPMVNTAEDADSARRSLRYRPHGNRGWGGSHTRRALWQGPTAVKALSSDETDGRGVYCPEYVEKSIDDVVSLFLIETDEGIANLDEILAVGEPDIVSFGWGDYSIEVNFDVEACHKAARTVYETCRAKGIGVSVSPGDTTLPFYPGCFSVAAIDAIVLNAGLESAIGRARAAGIAQATNAPV